MFVVTQDDVFCYLNYVFYYKFEAYNVLTYSLGTINIYIYIYNLLAYNTELMIRNVHALGMF